MPGKSNTNQTISKKNLHRMASNTKAINECFNTPESIFGYVIRHLGNSRISIALEDESITQATIRGLLRSKSTKIDIRDIVILEKDDSHSYYVIGVINDRKDINKLTKEHRIPKWFLSSDLQINEAAKRVDISKFKDSGIFEEDEEPILEKVSNIKEPNYDILNFGNSDEISKDFVVEDI